MGEFRAVIDAGVILSVLIIFTYLVRKDAKRDMLLARLLHHCGFDKDGNERENYERPSDHVVRVANEGIADGRIHIEKHRGRGA